jgi:predicted MPP superfamily phosphohydrolase
VSKYRKKGGLTHLQAFIDNELPLIAPDLVLATGDITDAKLDDSLKSKQHVEEWQAYYDALKELFNLTAVQTS